MARLYQSMALPFLFVPINAVAYVGLPQTQDGAGIEPAQRRAQSWRNDRHFDVADAAGVSDMQRHQAALVERLNPLDPNYNDWMR